MDSKQHVNCLNFLHLIDFAIAFLEERQNKDGCWKDERVLLSHRITVSNVNSSSSSLSSRSVRSRSSIRVQSSRPRVTRRLSWQIKLEKAYIAE